MNQTEAKKRQRMPKGEKYHFIDDCGFVGTKEDNRELQDDLRYKVGNYFPFGEEEEAESAICKFRAVLNGAEVIEMPSEMNEALQFDENEQEMKRKINEKGKDRINEFAYGWNACRNFIESKIVK